MKEAAPMAQRIFGVVIVSVLLAVGACSHPQKPVPAKVVAKASVPAKAPARPPTMQVGQPKMLTHAGAIYFDFDSALVREDARPVLQAIGETVKATNGTVRIEGHADERGTTEYNLA